jgi:hypothetical protein
VANKPAALGWSAVAPPKRKTGGRVTPKGTRPTDAPAKTATSATSGDAAHAHHAAVASSRYTPPVPLEMKSSPPWVPVLMLVFLVGGAISIMLRYLVFENQVPVVIGLVLILAGLYTATKWR